MANFDIGSCRDYFTPGCTDSVKLGYNALATIDDGSCMDLVLGCMNPTSTNYDSSATRDDASCILVNFGCMDPTATNYESAAEAEHPDPYYGCKFYTPGCTNAASWNFDKVATDDDGSCIPDRVRGLALPGKMAIEQCIMPNCGQGFASNCALNGLQQRYLELYDPPDPPINDPPDLRNASTYLCEENAEVGPPLSQPGNWATLVAPPNNRSVAVGTYVLSLFYCDGNYDPMGKCVLPKFGCMIPSALNFDPLATLDDLSCQVGVPGCTDSAASNYASAFNQDDGSCKLPIPGCNYPDAINFDCTATVDDGSCVYKNPGCTDSPAYNYKPSANFDDGTCKYIVIGCTLPVALNYNSLATSLGPTGMDMCTFPVPGCSDAAAVNFLPAGTNDDAFERNAECSWLDENPNNIFSQYKSLFGWPCPCAYAGCEDSTANNYVANANFKTLQATDR